jgi:signal transduction histidine kinase
MRERAEMLGGTLSATTGDAGGVVSARLPLTASPAG